MRTCNIEGCNKKHYGKGYCEMHYKRWYNYGSPHIKLKSGKGEVTQWILDFLKTENFGSDCILWPFGVNKVNGYGQFNYKGKMFTAHRAILILYTKNKGVNLDACHKPIICHNRLCVNPNHLYWGTRQQNANDMKLDDTLPKSRKRKYFR